jgi:glucosamine--fructose-6-phosphate aminotransferase (isomerizing)
MSVETSSGPGALMRKEIAEQPARWLDLLEHHRAEIDAAASLVADVHPELLVFVARGSSDHAAVYGQYLAHNLLRIPAMLATPATVTAFDTNLRYPSAVAIALSQSGESPDMLSTVRSITNAGVPLITITNDPKSALAALGQVHVPLSAGVELSVAATKTYTAELLVIALVLSRAAGIGWDDLECRVHAIADAATVAIQQPIEQLTDAFDSIDRMVFVGRGYGMATAKEGALKLMETNAIAASGWSAADATHGPLGQVIPGTGVIALTGSAAGRDSVLSFAKAAAELGGRIAEIGDLHVASAAVCLPAGSSDAELAPLVDIIPLQRLALELALRRGLDPDHPMGLAKVTKTH